ncbi:HMA2 domain-containing protein [Pseudodesulfovibrio sp.]|uniref:HMA2 domain-containing protein n=1 Tax=unclassified Pseudodesulfovibrio TaxID=2661612 RepID=UPI003B00F732
MSRLSVRHAQEGRIRFRVPAARNEQTALRIERRLNEVKGVRWARVNVRCSGVVVRYDRTVLSGNDVMAFMAGLAVEGEA